MDFLSQMHALMALQKTFPGMAWDIQEGTYSGPELRIVIPLDDDNAELFRQGRLMFAPR